MTKRRKSSKQQLISEVELTTLLVNSTILGASTSDTTEIITRYLGSVGEYLAFQKQEFDRPSGSYFSGFKIPNLEVPYHRKMLRR